MAIILAIATEGIFLGSRNLSNLFRQMAVVTILSSAIFLIIVTGGIDLSVGWLMGMLGAVSATLMNDVGMGVLPAILITILVGIIATSFHGVMVAFVKVPAFIVTMGGYMIYKGALVLILEGSTISKFPDAYTFLGSAYIPEMVSWIIAAVLILISTYAIFSKRKGRKNYNLSVESTGVAALKCILLAGAIIGFVLLMNDYEGVPVPVAFMFLVVFAVTVISEKTRFGRFIFCIGGNEEAAVYAGINVKKYKYMAYAMSGIITALASVVYTGRLDAATAQAGNTMELDAIASAVIGGTSLSGGIGKAPMILVGALMLALIDNGMSLLNISSDIQLIVKGAVLILAVVLDVTSNNNKK